MFYVSHTSTRKEKRKTETNHPFKENDQGGRNFKRTLIVKWNIKTENSSVIEKRNIKLQKIKNRKISKPVFSQVIRV